MRRLSGRGPCGNERGAGRVSRPAPRCVVQDFVLRDLAEAQRDLPEAQRDPPEAQRDPPEVLRDLPEVLRGPT